MLFEIVIPTIRANPDQLESCIEGVVETTGQKPVVVEGGTFAENCNLGASGTAADVVVFLNDDTDPLTGWIEPLLAPLDDKVGITGARLVYPDGRLQHAGIYFDKPGGVLTAHNLLVEAPSRTVEAVTGACMAVTRDAWHTLGGFDTGFVNGYEDVDLCLRARTAGFEVRYVAESVVIHHESQSGPARWTHVRHNIQRLQEKWNGDHLR